MAYQYEPLGFKSALSTETTNANAENTQPHIYETANVATPTKQPKPAKPKTLLAKLRDLGGVALSEKLDVTGEGRSFAPGGYNQIFKKDVKKSLKGLIESGDLDDYLPYNMRLEANGMNDDAFDSTEAYDYLTDKIRNGESVLPYDVQQEIDALNYEGDAVQDTANELTEEEINGQLQQAGREERESATNARIFNPTGENSGAGSSERSTATTEANANQQAEVATPERRADGDHRVERRTELQTRKNVNDMSADEMRAALLVDDLTGIGNRRAYDESQKLDYQVSIDADGLKWVNDNLGHESGDILLKAIGEAIGRVTHDGYHISGDEFIIQANNENVANDVMGTVNELLAESIIEGVNSNGDKVTLKGIGVSYGIAKDLKNAENKLQQHKQERETKGQRSGRGEQPANATITSKSQENNQDNTASQDLLGDNTAAKQALADAERAKDAKRNAGEDNQAGFNLSGSDSEFEQARAAGAQDLLSQDSKINLLTNDVLPNSESIEDIKQAAIKIAKEKFAGHTIKNISDNTDIIIGTQGIKHAMSGKVSKVSAVALSKLDEVIAKAKFVKSMPDKSGRNTIKEVRFYEADINLDGSNSKLTVVVRVAADGHRYYDHFEITNPTGQSGKSESQNSLQPFVGLVSETDNETVLQSNTESNTKDEVSRAKEALDNANVTGAERLDVVAKVRAGALTADDVVEAHGKTETTDKIEDFGQKIGGAKKDTYTRKAEQSRVLDIKTEPLAKTWPEPDYQELLDNGTDAWIVSFIRATREDIPRKPVKRSALSRWADTVTQLRDISYSLLDGSIPVSRAKEVLQNQSNGITDRIELYQLVGHSQSLKGLSITAGKYSIHNGVEYNPPKTLWAVNKEASGAMGNWGKDLVVGNTKQEVLQKFKEEFDTLQIQDAPKSKETSFDIYSYPKNTGKTGFFIGKKVGRNYIDLENFETAAEARAYKRDHNAELVAKLEKYKEIPNVRRDTNNPRVGEDMRNGQNATKQLFEDTFGFRGVEFGEWVENKKRQQDLNESFDALMDMAAILNIPPKAISLNGELGLAFGARGSGGIDAAKAHYEAAYVVINLTKKDGAGSLGHEWWHGLDNYFSRMRGKPSDFMTSPVLDVSLSARGANYVHQGAVRKEMIDAFGEVVKAINNTSLKARSSKLDAKRSKDYWSTGLEMSARAFETYLIAKIQDNNASNDYLANIVDEKTWAAAEKLGFELDASYPYPTAAEIPAIRGAFDHFFNVIESKETDTGGVALFSRNTATNDIPDAIILNDLGSAKSNKDYELAKSGDVEAATRLAKLLVTDDVINKLKSLANESDFIVGVTSVESTGNNALPEAAALLISEKLGVPYDENIVQSTSPKRTGMNGLDRIFNRPLFEGDVINGAGYIFVDDTITQGGTFAALSSHIEDGGGKVIANIALTGKQYSSKITLSEDALKQVREKFGDLENEFKQSTGYGYEGLTASEARYITSGISLDKFRDRITQESQKAASNTNPQASQNDLENSLFSRAASGDSLADKLQSIVDGDDILKGNVLIISENSPASLQMFGFNNLPVVTRTGADGVLKMHYEHGLSVSKLASVIENGLKRPAMILQYKGQNDVESLRFVTNETKNGNPIILAIQPEREGASGKVNLIASAFEVNAETIARAINNGDLLYRDTNAPMTDGVRKAVTRAQIKYAREPRSLLGVIPNSASSRKHAYKILSQSDIVKFENNNEGIYFSRAAIDTYSEHSNTNSIDNPTNIEEVNDNEAIRRIDRLQEAVRRHVNSRPARISKSVSVNQLARDGGGRGKGAASSWQLAGELANFFDQNVITFNNHTPHIFDFNGVAHGDSIFINANTNRPAHIVFGHEFLHRLKRENIEAYNKLVSIIDPLITDLKGFGKQEGIEDGFNDDYIKEELLGNLVANRFN